MTLLFSLESDTVSIFQCYSLYKHTWKDILENTAIKAVISSTHKTDRNIGDSRKLSPNMGKLSSSFSWPDLLISIIPLNCLEADRWVSHDSLHLGLISVVWKNSHNIHCISLNSSHQNIKTLSNKKKVENRNNSWTYKTP